MRILNKSMIRIESTTSIDLSKQLSMVVHGVAFFSASGYGIYHILEQSLLIGSLLILLSVNVIFSFIKTLKNQEDKRYLYGFIALSMLVLIVTSYELGFRGLILVFPMTASFWFLLSFRPAFICSSILIITCLIASTNSIDTDTTIRFSIALLLSLMFSASFAYVLSRQKNALEKDANEDYLTGIMNRRSFNTWLDAMLARTKKMDQTLTLFYIDIDDFKYVNDIYGHAVGDEVLLQFTKRITSLIRHNEIISHNNETINFARLAGDEFVLAILDMGDYRVAETIAKRFIDSMHTEFSLHDAEVKLNISIGIAVHNSESKSAADILKHADAAMYHAKRSGKNQYCFFNQAILEELSERKLIELSLREALDHNKFNLVFMPIYCCDSTSVVGAEVLLRSASEKLSSVGPDKYIPIAESHGLIREIDLWVIENTFIKIKSILNEPDMAHMWFAINISALELRNQEFPEKLRLLMQKYGIPPERVELEITETSLVSQDETSVITLKDLKALGISLSLDDFGTGYTAFNQLMHYPVDKLKLDRSFVSKIGSKDENHASMVDIVITIADSYNMKVIAEGVETQEQLDYLQKLNCDYVQGYLLSMPINWNSFLSAIKANANEKVTQLRVS